MQNVEKAAKKGTVKFFIRQNKKRSRTSPDVQFKKLSLTKQKTRPRTDYELIWKTIFEKKVR